MSSEIMFECIRENPEVLKMKNTLQILPNYLDRAVKGDLNIIKVLDHLFAEEAMGKKQRAYENQVRMSAIPMRKTLEDFDFSFQPFIDKCQIDELSTLRFMENA